MRRKNLLIVLILFIAISIIGSFLYFKRINDRRTVLSEHFTDLSAIIGGELQYYSLFGYTSSYASVTLEGIGLLQETKANNNGYFEFINFPAPTVIKEICLNNIDSESLASPPLCILLPKENTTEKYGPFLLPPTIKVNKANLMIGKATQITGRSIPGIKVEINTFSDKTTKEISFVKPAYAVEKNNKITTRTNSEGSFTVNLKGDATGKVRFFAQGNYSKQKTPKSNTLSIMITDAFYVFISVLLGFLLKLFTLNNLIILQGIIISILIVNRFLRGLKIYKNVERRIILWKKPFLKRINDSYLLVVDYCQIKLS